MTTMVYLHGFRSSPQSMKGRILKSYFGEMMTVLAPDLNVSPLEAQRIMLETVQGIDPSDLIIAGSSLGGFYAHWLAEEVGAWAILINPATEPWTVIDDYLGVQTIYGTDRTIEVKPEFLDQCLAMAREVSNPDRYFVMLAQGDEVLDWRLAHEKYAACEQLILQGNTHQIENFEQYLPALQAFVEKTSKQS